MSQQNQIVPVTVDINFFGANLSINKFAKNAIDWGRTNIVPNSPINCPCLNDDIYIANNGINHTVKQKKYDKQDNFNHETIAILSVLPELIENAKIRYIGPDRYHSPNIKCIKMLEASVIINGVQKRVE